jgi:hypothetical protein
MLRVLSYRSLVFGAALALSPFVLHAQAATTCADGTTSSATGKGACSGHGGVAKKGAKTKADTKIAKTEAKADTKVAKTEAKAAKADVKADTKSAAKTTKAADKLASKSVTSDVKETRKSASSDAAGATAKCKDGTYSHAATHRGACSRHGGVAEWLKS